MENKCCHVCDGKGFHYNSEGVYGQGFSKRVNCPTCHGTGQVSNDSFMQLLFWAGVGLILSIVAVVAAT